MILERFPLLWRLIRVTFYVFLGLGLVVALIPLTLPETGVNFADKLIHFFVFFCYAVWLNIISSRDFWRWQLPFMASYGMLTELLQGVVPWRSFSLLDWLFDVFGLVLYGIIWHFIGGYVRSFVERVIKHGAN